MKSIFAGNTEDDIGLGRKIVAGAVTGAIGTTLANPVDVVRVRLQGESGLVDARTGLFKTGLYKGRAPSYRHTFHAFAAIARDEGIVNGLWRGTSANILRGVLLSASQLATYDHTKHLMKENGLMEEGVPLHFTASFISGLVAQTVIMPADTMKTRVMNDRMRYSGLLDCLQKTVKEEGLIALYKGFVPALARQGPVMVIQMPIVEQLRRLVGLDYF